MKNNHIDNDRVKSAIALPQAKRNEEIAKIRKEAMHRDNISRQMRGEPLVRQRTQKTSGYDVLCTGCNGIASTVCIHRHRAKCSMIEEKNIPRSSSSLHVAKHNVVEPDDFTTNILKHFRDCPVGNICRDDASIVAFGKSLYQDSHQDRRKVMGPMRLVG